MSPLDEPTAGQAPRKVVCVSGDARRSSRLVRWSLLVGSLVLVAAAITGGAIWWDERPLREAQRAYRSGDYEQTLGLVSYFLETRPDHGGALALKARALASLGRAEEAVAGFELTGAADSRDTQLWADSLMRMGQFTRALPMLIRVRKLEPHNADAVYQLTVCHMRLQLFDQAISTAEEYAALPGCEARGRFLLATIHHDLRNYERAARECQRVLEMEPDGEHLPIPPAEVFRFYGQTLLQAGRPRDALPPLGRSTLLAPAAGTYALLGNAADQVGESVRAESLWRSAIQLDAAHREAREGLANAALREQNGKQALTWLEPLANDPELRSSTAYLFQRAHLLSQDPDSATAWQARADRLRTRERLLLTIDRIVTESPDSYWAWVIQAYRFAERGNWEQARAIIKKIPSGDPSEPFVRELADAIWNRSTLPDLGGIPIADH